MKKFLLLVLLLPAILFGQNRVVTVKDTALYHVVQIGDLIIDTPTNPVPFADGANKVTYIYFSKSFPTFKDGGTIWIDGKKLGKVCEFRLLNGKEDTPWHVSTVTLKPIPGTRVDGVYTPNGYGGFLYLLQGVKYLKVHGSSKEFPGLYGLKDGESAKGKFGFGATSTGIYAGYHGYSISVLDGGSLDIEGFESEHGFSGLRFEGGSYDWKVKLKVRNFYVHDTESEGFYIGATHVPPYAKIEMDIADGLIIRSGSEGLQLQHIIGNSCIRNVTIAGTDAGYIAQFQPSQDTGMQFSPDGGTIKIANILLDTWGSHGINMFGTPYTDSIKSCSIKAIAMINGRGEPVYEHNSCRNGMNWLIDSLFIGNLTKDYYINSKTKPPSWSLSIANGTDKITTSNINYTAPQPTYVNSGAYETQNRFKYYRKYYAKYISGTDTSRVQYRVGDIVIDREPGKLPVFTKCVRDNLATDIRPKNDFVNYILLSWDSKGVRSDQVNFNHLSIQKLYPPDDFRVKAGSFYSKLGIGYLEPKVTTIDSLLAVLKAKESLFNKQLDSLNTVLLDLASENNRISIELDKALQNNTRLEADKKNILSEIQTTIDNHK